MSLVLAVDLGGSGLKAGLLPEQGAPVAQFRAGLGFDEPGGGVSEADPESWWRALGQAVAAMPAEALGRVSIIALCGFTRSQVFLDAAGGVLRPAMSFRDSRADALAQELAQRIGTPAAALNGFHPLARLAYLQRHAPQIWSRLHRVVEPKDYLALRLTGTILSDRVSMRWLDEGYGSGLAAACGLDREVLPPLGRPLDIAGTVRPGLPGALAALAGRPVLLGSNDTWMAVAGMDAMAPGRAYCVSGSSEVLGLLTSAPARAEGLVAIDWGHPGGAGAQALRPDAGPAGHPAATAAGSAAAGALSGAAADPGGLWHLGGPGLNGANVLDWAGALLGTDLPEAPPEPLLFLPFLLGERVPYWDAGLRAAILGADARTGPASLMRAAMEGVALLNRTVLERAEAAAGITAPELRLGGGGARNARWNRIRADILGRPVLVPQVGETGLAGCHVAARVALGEAPDLPSAARAVLPPPLRIEPDPEAAARSDALHALFLDAHEAVAPLSRRLAALGRG